MAEEQGFEPWMGYKPMPVFKTGAFNHSATPPTPCILPKAGRSCKLINADVGANGHLMVIMALINGANP
jgi:hypothetical protein